MKLRSMMMLALALTFACHGVVAQAGEGGCSGGCAGLLEAPCPVPRGNIHIMGSGTTTPEQMAQYARMVDEIYGAWHSLGGVVPHNEIRWANATDMAGITFTGGHPAPDALDGAQVLKASRQAAGILEVVFTGEPNHQQFIRSTNTGSENEVVLAHVAGHYTFFATSTLFRIRQADPVRASYEYATYMSEVQGQVDKDQIAAFHLKLKSLDFLQDVTRGTFDEPGQFANGNLTAPTRSILQALSRNLPATAPAWQRRMIELYEASQRHIGAAVMTKIMNEGFAEMAVYLNLPHTPYNTHEHSMAHGVLNASVRYGTDAKGRPKGPSLSNPYWLGTEAWLRVWERFVARPEIRTLSPKEQDTQFLAEAIRLNAQYNDYTFLLYALDEEWVREHQLFLQRPSGQHSPEGKPMDVVVTRDWRRVVRSLANAVANHENHFPVLELVQLQGPNGAGAVLRHRPVRDIPLELDSMGQTLYILAKMLDRPVSMVTIGSSLWQPSDVRNNGPSFPFRPFFPSPVPVPTAPFTFPMQVTVNTFGEVTVTAQQSPDQPQQVDMAKIKEKLEAAIAAHQYDLELSYPNAETPQDLTKFQSALLTGMGGPSVVDAAARMTTHTPTAPAALTEYLRVAGVRLYRSLKLAVQGKFPIKMKRNSVRVRVLPHVPSFQLDPKALKARPGSVSPTPVDRVTLSAVSTTATMPDEDLSIGGGPVVPGDFVPGQDPDGDGGDGDGEGEEGEPGDEKKPGKGKGQGEGGDPAFAEVPIELYGEMLAEAIQLRNMRSTEGDAMQPDEVLTGHVRRPGGRMHYPQTARRIYRRGLAEERRQARLEGRRPRMRPIGVMRQGLRNYRPEDRVVYDVEREPIPDTDAVIVWSRDYSGSISAEHRKIISDSMANIRAVLRARYPYLKERFVIISDDAKEVNEKQFFSVANGGGTQIITGVRKMEEIYQEYPREQFNRFGMLFSDGGDFGTDQTVAAIDKLSDELEHFAYGHIHPQETDPDSLGAFEDLSLKMKVLAERKPEFVGFAIINKTFASIIRALRTYYGSPPVATPTP